MNGGPVLRIGTSFISWAPATLEASGATTIGQMRLVKHSGLGFVLS